MNLIIVLIRCNKVHILTQRERLRIDEVGVVLIWLLTILSTYIVFSMLDFAQITFISYSEIRTLFNGFILQIIVGRVNRIMVVTILKRFSLRRLVRYLIYNAGEMSLDH